MSRRFGGTYSFHLQGREIIRARNQLVLDPEDESDVGLSMLEETITQ
jgi:hypothetical protein